MLAQSRVFAPGLILPVPPPTKPGTIVVTTRETVILGAENVAEENCTTLPARTGVGRGEAVV